MNSEQEYIKFHVWIEIKKYVGETSSSINKQIYKHTRDLKKKKQI